MNIKFNSTRITLLHIASWAGNNDLVRLLIDNGAKLNELIAEGDNEGLTPLDYAFMANKQDVAEILIKYGAKKGDAMRFKILGFKKGINISDFRILVRTKNDNKKFTIEATQDFIFWEPIGVGYGNGKLNEIKDNRKPLLPFKKNFYRIKFLE